MTSSNAFSDILRRDLSLVIPAAFTTILRGGPSATDIIQCNMPLLQLIKPEVIDIDTERPISNTRRSVHIIYYQHICLLEKKIKR